LISICEACHAVVHSGRTSVVTLDAADYKNDSAISAKQRIAERLCTVNNWTPEQAAAHRDLARDLFDQRSDIQWYVDISYIEQAEADLLKGRLPALLPGAGDDISVEPPAPAAAATAFIELAVTPDEVRELERRAEICTGGSIENYVRMRLLEEHSLHAGQVLFGQLLPIVQLGRRCACGVGQRISDTVRARYQSLH